MGIFDFNKINAEVCGTGNVLNALQSYNTVVLKPHIVDNKNILTENMLKNANTKYVIRWDYDLAGETITMQPGCIIEFDGGSIKNGTLVGNNTVLIYSQGMQDIIKEDAELTGTWKKPDIIPAIPTKVSAFENDVNYTKGSAGSIRPANVPVGYMFFDTDLNEAIYWNGSKWCDSEGFTPAAKRGDSDSRPIGRHSEPDEHETLVWVGDLLPSDVGFRYFDTTLGITIYAKEINNTTGYVTWVNEEGINMTNVTMVIGTSAQRNAMAASLSEVNEGLKFLDTNFGQYAVWNGGRWVGEDGFSLCPKSGETANRPQGAAAEVRNYLDWQYDLGFEYFDLTLNKPIYVKRISRSTGLVEWVDSNSNVCMELPFDGFVENVQTEQTGFSGIPDSILFVTGLGKFVAKVDAGLNTKYYTTWNDESAEIPVADKYITPSDSTLYSYDDKSYKYSNDELIIVS